MNFQSDNVFGCAPEVLEAIVRTNRGTAPSYGRDDITAGLRDRVSKIFEADVEILPVVTGIAANALAIAASTPPWGAIYCHRHSHVYAHEYAASEFFSGGAKMLPLGGSHGKIAADDLLACIEGTGPAAEPACVSLTQATEAGTLYRPHEIRAIADAAHRQGLVVHMDGARLANALAALDVAPADLTWRAGVDIVAVGATKNGAMAADVIVAFRRDLAQSLPHRRKRGGQLLSKMRFVSAQLEAYFADDLWLRNARKANAASARLGAGLSAVSGVTLLQPVETNQVFVDLPPLVTTGLRDAGFQFFDWPVFGPNAVRLVTGFATEPSDVDAFVSAATRLVGRT